MRVAVDLHVHTAADADACGTPSQLVAVGRQRMADMLLLGFVGHDFRPEVAVEGALSVTGIEHEVRREPTRLHVIEYPDHDLQMLAHPAMTWPEQTASRMVRWLRETDRDIDAVERWRGGVEQYTGALTRRAPDLGVTELAGSDAHSGLVLGSSFVVADVREVSVDAVMRAVREGRVEPVVQPPPWHRSWLAGAEKALSMLASEPAAAARVGRQRLGLKLPGQE